MMMAVAEDAPPADAASSGAAADDAIAADDGAGSDDAGELSGLRARCLPPRPIFPWRSSPYPLPRLVGPTMSRGGGGEEGDDPDRLLHRAIGAHHDGEYFARGGPLGPGWPSPMEPWFRGALYLTSMNLLGLSWPYVIMPWTRRDWERDMEWGFCHAFSNGVNGMIEDTYCTTSPDGDGVGPEKSETGTEQRLDDDGEAYDVDVDISLDPLPPDEGGDGSGAASNDGEVSDGAIDDEHSMLQRNLRQLYEGARRHSHPSKVNIVLRTVPHSATIESMFPVFGLSRSLVEDHPYLRHTYRNYLKRLQAKHKEAVLAGKSRLNPVQVGSFIMDGLQEVMEGSARLSSDGKAVITIVAQVSIKCKEVFCVRDVESGDVIQGYGDARPRDVTHLVRFEMVVRETLANADDSADISKEGEWKLEIGRWQITDWDDIMDGNVFFT
ncbi:hypothetical protein ACHAW5_006542 [Stephanodiscus triporus]|uniref:Tim44-like domain-containing protein n=1 Tax=Stephanodiscus triporus TaxID=2934178 RepID=A0ABD3PS80_9STRA